MQITAYSWLMLAGILLSLWFWKREAPRRRGMGMIYFAALVGAFVGAKIVYVLAEGWLHWNDANRWLILATGKTIVGALLGGYAGVEIAKRAVGYTGVTGDFFATIAPVSIVLGRIGCLIHGCCLGVVCSDSWFAMHDRLGIARWPAVPAEIAFNLLTLVGLSMLRRRKMLPGQHFHLYLIAYGFFRFGHEFARETPKIAGPFSGYHLAALALVALGLIRFAQRRRSAISGIHFGEAIAQDSAIANAHIKC
jgi:phosphatidylglycerol---prolipoprotein diacylglyceryl transferase